PVVDASEVGDRLHDDETLRPAGGALDERGEDLRPLSSAHGERLIDDRQADARERAPLDGARQQHLGVAILPGAQQVARAEQLGARVVADDRLAYEQPVEHEQADWIGSAGERAGGRPRAARHVYGAREEPLADLANASRI